MSDIEWVDQFIEKTKTKWINASDFIWEHPEIRFEEHVSANYLMDLLSEAGFDIKRNVADIETAFVAEYGTSGPVVGFLGEYDALSGLSQKADVYEAEPITGNGLGHGCGHNLLGVAALASAIALKNYLQEKKLNARIRFYGCPAEEGGSGKTFMVRAGAFDDVDFALTWHPGPITAAWSFSTLANIQAYFRFKGVSAHAAAAPHLGRSALDAVELMNVGVNYLREHMTDAARIHYAITNAGGTSPNVVQANTEVVQLIRAPQINEATELYERVKKIAQGAALMTETEVEIVFDKAASNFIPNDILNEVMSEVINKMGGPNFTAAEMGVAEKYQETLDPAELAAANQGFKELNPFIQKPLSDTPVPYFKTRQILSGSTDVGDVSWVTPTAQLMSSTMAVGTSFHTWQLVAQGKSSYAHKGMLYTSKILALTAIHMLKNPDLIQKAKAEQEDFNYTSPIPDSVKPNKNRAEGIK